MRASRTEHPASILRPRPARRGGAGRHQARMSLVRRPLFSLFALLAIASTLVVVDSAASLAPAGAAVAPSVDCSKIYGLDWNVNPHYVWEIDPATGVSTRIGTTPTFAGTMNALALDAETGTLWFSTQVASRPRYVFVWVLKPYTTPVEPMSWPMT